MLTPASVHARWVELSWVEHTALIPIFVRQNAAPCLWNQLPASLRQPRRHALYLFNSDEWPLFFHWFHWLTTIIFHDPLTLTPCLIPSFSANPSQRSHVFLLQEWLHGLPSLFTDISEHIRFYFLVFLPLFSCWVPCSRLSWLMSAFTLK